MTAGPATVERVDLLRAPLPLDRAGLALRLRVMLDLLGLFLLGFPCLVVAILMFASIGLIPALGLGVVTLLALWSAAAGLADVGRRITSRLLGRDIPSGRVDTRDLGFWRRVAVWLSDEQRWRDVGYTMFSATAGLALSGLVVTLGAAPISHVVLAIVLPDQLSKLIFLGLVPVSVVLWWVVTPYLAYARLSADAAILGASRTTVLRERVDAVSRTRAETVDASAAELRRIERDLHDGAQARLASLGMSLGLAEQLLRDDPERAARLLAEARSTTVTALEDLRSVVRTVHPPVLADRGLAGGVEALVLDLAVPVTSSIDLAGRPPAPVESAAYFAVAECLANVVKHSSARRAWVSVRHEDGRLRLLVGDDGVGGADRDAGSGLAGVARRLAAFDGTMEVSSPEGGPTTIEMEIPCALSSPRTTPS